MNNSVIERIRARTEPETRLYVQKNLDISCRVNELLQQKGWTQKDLAKALGKTESEVSRWLSGMHNLTLKSIVKLEVVLRENILIIPDRMTKNNTVAYPKVLSEIEPSECFSDTL